jgi:alpha-galactosidase
MNYKARYKVSGIILLTFMLICLAVPKINAQDRKLALTPPMGFNSWNAFEAKIDEAKIKAIADIMVSSGMRDAGYAYLVLDDGWMAAERDSAGNLQADPVKFPSGMKAIGDYIHSKGLLYGIYECRGIKTCQGLPGSFKHEQADMNSFASWGVDYIKLDACYAEKTGLLTTEHLKIFHDCIEKTGRPMILSISDFGNGAWAWGGKEFGELWRTSYDIYPWMESVYHCANTSGGDGTSHPGFNGLWQFAGPGHWNDPDMLQVGNLKNEAENRAHFSLWCILAAPLMAGCDLRTVSDTVLRIFTAKEVIAINQDPRGHQGYKVYQKGGIEIYNKPLFDGTTAVLLLNKDSLPADISVKWDKIGLAGTQKVRDLWAGKDIGSFNGSFTAKGLTQNGVMLIKVGTPGGKLVAGPEPAPLEKYSITKSGTTSLRDIWYIMKSGDAPRYDKSHSGTRISVGGITYDKGFGCKTESRIMFKLNGKADRFKASVGIDDSYDGTEAGSFRVLNEDAFGSRAVFDSKKMLKGAKAIDIDIDVKGLEFILLEFRGKEVIGNWIDPRIVGSRQ